MTLLEDVAKAVLKDYDAKKILDAGDPAIKAATDAVEMAVKSGTIKDEDDTKLKSASRDQIEKVTKDTLEASAIEDTSKTTSNSDAVKKVLDKYEKKESVINTYTRTRENITDSLGLTDAMNDFAETGSLDATDEDIDLARELYPEIDSLLDQFISETIDLDDFADTLASNGVPDEIIMSLVEKVYSDEPTFEVSEEFNPTEDQIEMVNELVHRGLSDEDLIEYMVLKYDVSEHNASIIIDTVKAANLHPEDIPLTEDPMSQISSDIIVTRGEDVTDTWEQKFEEAIDEFDGSYSEEEPYAEDELYDYLYKKFEVPEDIACDILASSDMNIPKAVITLCEHCRKISKEISK